MRGLGEGSGAGRTEVISRRRAHGQSPPIDHLNSNLMISAGVGYRRTIAQRVLGVQFATYVVNGLFDRSVFDRGSVEPTRRGRGYFQRTLFDSRLGVLHDPSC